MEKARLSLIQNPRSLLKFRGPFTSQASTILKLINSSKTRVAFRITAPTPKHISVSPEYGAVDAHHLIEILVSVEPYEREKLHDGKHILHVESMFAPSPDRDPKQQLSEAPSEDLMISELECVFESADVADPESFASTKREKIINYAVIESESEDTESKTSVVRSTQDEHNEVECARFDFDTQQYDINNALKHGDKRTTSEAQTMFTWKVVKCARCGKKENLPTPVMPKEASRTQNTQTIEKQENSIIFAANDNDETCMIVEADNNFYGYSDVACGESANFAPVLKDVASGVSKNLSAYFNDAIPMGEADMLTQELHDIKQNIIALQQICGTLKEPQPTPPRQELSSLFPILLILSISVLVFGIIVGNLTLRALGINFFTHIRRMWIQCTKNNKK